ncbi:MAG: hypothetical protein VX294_00165 [Candidatus Latescibacterota bacterium]|nr:hypothetical protein [Candidatus Latescibacterota bacterium]
MKSFLRTHLLGYLLAFLLLLTVSSQAIPMRYHQDSDPIDSFFGTEIGDIVWSGKYLWVATENGVARLDPTKADGTSPVDWVTFTQNNGMGRGSVSALDAIGDTVWVATIIDTLTPIGLRQMGTGLSFSHNAGLTWKNIPGEKIFNQANLGFERGPGTQIDNGCFGISIGNESIWAAFFAGSTVKLTSDGNQYQRILPDGAKDIVFFPGETAADSLLAVADSLININADSTLILQAIIDADSLAKQSLLHRTFSVLTLGDTVWVGTSNGLAQSTDDGETWHTIKVRSDSNGIITKGGIGGNWVVSIHRHIETSGKSTIWVGTNSTGDPGERPSISFSDDDGATWEITGQTFAWDFAFTHNYAWATTNSGLIRRPLQSDSWEPVDLSKGMTFVGIEAITLQNENTLWAGSENGLSATNNEGKSWSIIRDLVRTASLDANLFVNQSGVRDSVSVSYAAPNPFAPSDGEQALITFSLTNEAIATIDVFDFASRKVRSLTRNTSFSGGLSHHVPWDGRNNEGRKVSNGTYFFRIQLESGPVSFGKVVVLD